MPADSLAEILRQRPEFSLGVSVEHRVVGLVRQVRRRRDVAWAVTVRFPGIGLAARARSGAVRTVVPASAASGLPILTPVAIVPEFPVTTAGPPVSVPRPGVAGPPLVGAGASPGVAGTPVVGRTAAVPRAAVVPRAALAAVAIPVPAVAIITPALVPGPVRPAAAIVPAARLPTAVVAPAAASPRVGSSALATVPLTSTALTSPAILAATTSPVVRPAAGSAPVVAAAPVVTA
ncbi:hypothetical protein GCM10009676_10420 [Prauserella halophila]|uniref:Uncharacterized protein n=1 Tax=Prauserella halophila TaxID=185641 RepID=A0ABN1W4I5_9PSEU